MADLRALRDEGEEQTSIVHSSALFPGKQKGWAGAYASAEGAALMPLANAGKYQRGVPTQLVHKVFHKGGDPPRPPPRPVIAGGL